jgi:hypothetical protein
MNRIDFNEFRSLHSKFLSNETFTKKKREDLENLLGYLKAHDFVEISMNKKYMSINKIWNFEIYQVPSYKNGKLKIWRGEKVLRFCISYSLYEGNILICCPLEKLDELRINKF